MAFSRFIQTAEDGSVVRVRTSSDQPIGGAWIEVPELEQGLLGLEPHRLRWDDQAGLTEKLRIRLSVGAFLWPADGESENAISVRGGALADDTPVTVRVNNTEYQIAKSDGLLLTSALPGNYTVRVVDPYFYAVPGEITITATEVDDAES